MPLDLSDELPYDLTPGHGKISYSFRTAIDIEYYIIFNDTSATYDTAAIGASVIYEFEFFPDRDVSDIPHDERVMATILYAIHRTMQAYENVVLYICDNSDGRQQVRARYFNRLFHHNNEIGLQKIDGIVKASPYNEEDRFVSVIYHPSNPSSEILRRTFEEALFHIDLSKTPEW